MCGVYVSVECDVCVVSDVMCGGVMYVSVCVCSVECDV